MPRAPKPEQLLLPSITAVVSLMHEDHMLRAVVRDWPGGAPDLFLERIDFADEAEPYHVERRVAVSHNGTSIEGMYFDEEGLHFTDSRGRKMFVRASSDALSEKAIRDE
jgi:hypothetical protein